MTLAAEKHFQKNDPILYGVALRVGPLEPLLSQPQRQHFRSLCQEIISQQLANAAARIILERFFALFPRSTPTARLLVRIPDQTLRDCGLSWAKVRYLKNLAQKIEAREIRLAHLSFCSDEEVIAELMRIKGIGRWTAEMFLIFSLGREDVFSFGDRGLQRAMEKLYDMPAFSPLLAEPIVEQWKPYRSWASRLLWQSLKVP